MWDCNGDRAPDPYGFNFKFLKRCWDWIGQDFLNLFNNFYASNSITPGCSSTFIALILNINDPASHSENFLISLVSFINKVISKVLVHMLKPVMRSIVSEEQFAYMADINILDGPLILIKLITYF
jgi:hypothetical protein